MAHETPPARSTASSSTPRAAPRSTTSTRPPRRCSAPSPTAPPPTWRRAVAAARRAFDTDGVGHRPRPAPGVPRSSCRPPSRPSRRSCGPSWSPRSACPVLLTYGPQLDAPAPRGAHLAGRDDRRVPVAARARRRGRLRHGLPVEREVWKEPVGVVGVIVPWNFPVEITLNKLGPVLAMGNTCVLKPAPDTPWNATRIGRLIAEQTDIPPGVVNVVPSTDHLVGEVLTTSPDVDMVAFTGSTATGRRVMEAGAATLKPVFLELGGQVGQPRPRRRRLSPPPWPARSMCCVHAGQGCAIPTRLLVPRSRYDEAVDVLADGVRRGGPTATPPTRRYLQGPQISARQQRPGARLHRAGPGGGRPPRDGRRACPPTCPGAGSSSRRCSPTSTTHDHRPGGDLRPGAGRHPATTDDDDAVRIANDSPYGLRARSPPATSNGPRRSPGASAPGRSASTAASGTAPTPRSAATSSRASGGSAASRAWRCSPRRRRSAGRRR